MTFRRVAAFSHNSCSSFLWDNKMPPCDLKPACENGDMLVLIHSLCSLVTFHTELETLLFHTLAHKFNFKSFSALWISEWGRHKEKWKMNSIPWFSTLFPDERRRHDFLPCSCRFGVCMGRPRHPLWSGCTTHKTYCETAGVLLEMNKTFIINFHQLVNFLLLIDWHIYAA